MTRDERARYREGYRPLPARWGEHSDDGRCPIANCPACIQAELDQGAAERLGPLTLRAKYGGNDYDGA